MPQDYNKMLESLYNHTVPVINCRELMDDITTGKGMFILDIRSSEEYSISHLEGARLIEYKHFNPMDIQDIPASADIVVYCSVGFRSEKIGEKLMARGYKNVKNLYGGIFQWKNDGFEVVNEKSMKTDSVHTYNKRWSKWLKNGTKVY